MELRQINTFLVVAETLNFTRASEQLFLAQSSVSAQIRALEDDLGVKLFDRIGRRIYLSDAGKDFYEYARRMKGMVDEIYSTVGSETTAQGNLTIRVPETVATTYFPQIATRYYKEFPKVRFECINCSDRALPRELNSGKIDLAFLLTDIVHMENVNVRYLKNEQLSLVASAENPLLKKRNLQLNELNQQTFLLTTSD